MSFHDDAFLDAVAALAAGALPPAEAAKTEAHLGECAVCRAELAELSAAIPVVGLAETASSETWSASAAARLKQRILHGVTQPAPVAAPHATTVPTEAMRPYAPGVSWTVIPAAGMTLIYWIFEPPTCTSLPVEQHVQTQGGIVLDGAMTLRYRDGSEQTCRTGEVYTIAPNVAHRAFFDERTVIFDVYTPNHREFEAQYRSAFA